MGIDLKGRSFLTLKDFTPEEINFMLDYAAALKKKKKKDARASCWLARTSCCCSRKHPPAPAALSRSPALTRAPA